MDGIAMPTAPDPHAHCPYSLQPGRTPVHPRAPPRGPTHRARVGGPPQADRALRSFLPWSLQPLPLLRLRLTTAAGTGCFDRPLSKQPVKAATNAGSSPRVSPGASAHRKQLCCRVPGCLATPDAGPGCHSNHRTRRAQMPPASEEVALGPALDGASGPAPLALQTGRTPQSLQGLFGICCVQPGIALEKKRCIVHR